MALTLRWFVVLKVKLLTHMKGSGSAICAAKPIAGSAAVHRFEKAAGTELSEENLSTGKRR